MFTVEKVEVNRLDIAISGKLDKEEMELALDELVEKSQGMDKAIMLYDIESFHIPSLSAIAVELSRFPQMMKFIKRFRKAAVLTDEDWIKKISEFEGWLLPGIEIKGFDRNEREKAVDWLTRQ